MPCVEFSSFSAELTSLFSIFRRHTGSLRDFLLSVLISGCELNGGCSCSNILTTQTLVNFSPYLVFFLKKFLPLCSATLM